MREHDGYQPALGVRPGSEVAMVVSGMSVKVTPPTDRRLAIFDADRRHAARRARHRLAAVCGVVLLVLGAAAIAETSAVTTPTHPEFTRGLRLYESGRFEKAVAAFEKLAAGEPENDVYAYWLGKACGRVAERAGPLSALKWAGRTRDALERAVELNPDNADAVSSLADYYEQAPGFLGGDAAKARELRARLRSLPADADAALGNPAPSAPNAGS